MAEICCGETMPAPPASASLARRRARVEMAVAEACRSSYSSTPAADEGGATRCGKRRRVACAAAAPARSCQRPRTTTTTGFGSTWWLRYGVTSVCGLRREMEDAVSIRPDFLRGAAADPSSGKHHFYYGVFDGHGCCHAERYFICNDTGALLHDADTFPDVKNDTIVKFSVLELSEVKRVASHHLRLCFKPLDCLKDYHNLKPSAFIHPTDQRIFGSTRVFIALHSSMLPLGRPGVVKAIEELKTSVYGENYDQKDAEAAAGKASRGDASKKLKEISCADKCSL